MMLEGHLNMETVPTWFTAGSQRLASEDLWVDFSKVVSVDSAAIGMLLGWVRAAQRSGRKLQVKNMSEALLSLSRLYGVDELLPQQSA